MFVNICHVGPPGEKPTLHRPNSSEAGWWVEGFLDLFIPIILHVQNTTYGHVYFVSLSNPAHQIHHGKVFQILNFGPIFICWRPRGSLRIPRNHKRGGQGLGPWAGPGQGPAASFVVPGDPKAAPGSPAYEYQNMGPKLLIWQTFPWWASLLKSLCRYKIDIATYIIYIYIYNIYNIYTHERWRQLKTIEKYKGH